MSPRPKIAVVGCGLMGAAAARHLAKAGHDTTLIGPDEPGDLSTHSGVFASHYDEGRITRKNATDPFWAEVSIASIARYAEIEAESGLQFYSPVGAMMAGRADGPFLTQVLQSAAKLGVETERLDRAALAQRFAQFAFPDSFAAYYEATDAGHISPRRLVVAQTRAAQSFGARRLQATVARLTETADQITLHTDQGDVTADQVIVAAGGWSDHVLGRPRTLSVYARTVAFFAISQAQADALTGQPSLIFEHRSNEAPYLLPPIRYPDGRFYLKLGGDPDDLRLDTPAALTAWYQGGGDPQVRDYLEGMFRTVMPDVVVDGVSMAPCVTSWTGDRRAEIARLSDRITVCTGGNGAGAKNSDELGRRAARLATAPYDDERIAT